jgi:8-hydroxy-5-deazaflavin:NADPH oxidoreductase
VLGTGGAGRTIAARLDELGHGVTIGTRDPAATSQREEYAAWAAAWPGVALATFEDAAAGAEMVFLVTSGDAALGALDLAGPGNLDRKVVVDVTNPLDFSAGFPPTLSVKDTDSLGEQLQRAHPEARLVKALNTMNSSVMVRPDSLSEPTSAFVAGNDEAAKGIVTGLLEDFGHTDVIDLGDISMARGTEMFLPLWVRLTGCLGTASFNIKVVR